MREFLILGVHLLVTIAKLCRPGGTRAVVAESLLLKQQLLVSNRARQRAPNLTSFDRCLLGATSLFVNQRRIGKIAALISPATLLKFQRALVDRKYSLLFSSKASARKPGPKGPSAELIAAIIELKIRNPRFGCVRIAQQISYTFDIAIDKDVVRRVLARHYRPGAGGSDGPSWLSFLAHSKDSLWSLDLFRCESILLRSYWVLVAVDLFTRRIVGFGVNRFIDGPSVCRMFNDVMAGQLPPKRLSTDHDSTFRFHQWLANLRVLEIEEVKSVPYVPVSHPYVERLIGTIRREYLDRTFFWNGLDLARKLEAYRVYYNNYRVHRALDGATPAMRAGSPSPTPTDLARYAWQQHCRGLFQTPIPA